jgi:uncharacterized protein
MKYIKLSWELIDELTDKIAIEVSRNYKEIKFIYGIPRGGLIPAVILSHKLGIKLINEVFSHTLVVDDIVDTGETMKIRVAEANIWGDTRNIVTTSLVTRSSAEYKPNITGMPLRSDGWVCYPWENSEHYNNDASEYMSRHDKSHIQKNLPKKIPTVYPIITQKGRE